MEIGNQLISIFADRGISFSEKRKSVVMDCPNPTCGKEEHCWMKKETGQAICFKCGTKWSWKGFVAAVLKISRSEAFRIVYGQNTGDDLEVVDSDLPKIGSLESFIQDEVEPKPIALTPDFVPASNSERAISYLKSRGIVDNAIYSCYDLRYQALIDAVIFPIGKEGRLYGWQGRAIPPIAEGRLRLVNSTGFNKSQFLLNYDRARTSDRIILVEGPFDCMKVDLPGFGAVCSFGKTVSPQQIKLLLDMPAKEIYLGLDRDAAEEIYDLSEALGSTKKVYRILPPEHRKDFGECDALEVIDALENAQELDSFPASRLEVYLKS